LVVANRDYSYVLCTACGFRRQHVLPSAEEEEQLYDAEFYFDRALELGLDDQSILMRGLIEGRVRQLTKLSGGPRRLLDVGAGTGLFVEASVRAGWDAVGVEPSQAAVRISSKITRAQVIAGRMETVTFDQTFDAVTFWDVLEHLPDPRATLAITHSRLDDGGLVAISLPNASSLKARLLGNRWRYFRKEFGHVSHFTPRTLSILLGQAAFAPVSVQTSGAFNLGKAFGLDPSAVRERHSGLNQMQVAADFLAGALRLGEHLVVFARKHPA
jgi:SAM-dependent methyltransferase